MRRAQFWICEGCFWTNKPEDIVCVRCFTNAPKQRGIRVNTRIYLVATLDNSEHVTEYLVEATSQSQARTHVAKKFIAVEAARPIDVAKLMGRGIKLETASETVDNGATTGNTGAIVPAPKE
jgi:hypothetical protein